LNKKNNENKEAEGASGRDFFKTLAHDLSMFIISEIMHS